MIDKGIINFTKFKVGDKIIMNSKANSHYGVTRQGWKGTIITIYESSNSKNIYSVKEEHGISIFSNIEESCMELRQ